MPSFQDACHLIKEDMNGSIEEKEFDPRSILTSLPPLPALEAFNKHRDFLANSQSLLAGLGGHVRIPLTAAPVLGIPGFQPPNTTYSPLSGSLPNTPSVIHTAPTRPPSQPTTPSSQQSSSPVQQNFSPQQNWSFEEQFKQVRQ